LTSTEARLDPDDADHGAKLASVPADATRVLHSTHGVVRFIWNHPANHGKRIKSLARAVRFQVRGRLLGRRSITRLGDRSVIWSQLHRTASSKAVYANPPDYPEMLVWARELTPGSLFIDVGANIGLYTIWACEHGARVVALEPAADTFELLRENVALNGYEAHLMRAAAGDRDGIASFTSGRDCTNRLDPSGEDEVRVVTIDSVLDGQVAEGMKVDVEGHELAVLMGCRDALASGRILLMQIEWNDASESAVNGDRRPIADLLAGFGYSLCRPDDDGELVDAGRYPGYGPDVFARRTPIHTAVATADSHLSH
jgi:FkbM family methyltransferase